MTDESTGPLHELPGEPSAAAIAARDGRPVRRPEGLGAYWFAVVAGLRAGQLLRGCTPRVAAGAHRATVVAQLEIAGGKIAEVGEPGAPIARVVDVRGE